MRRNTSSGFGRGFGVASFFHVGPLAMTKRKSNIVVSREMIDAGSSVFEFLKETAHSWRSNERFGHPHRDLDHAAHRGRPQRFPLRRRFEALQSR